VSLRNELFLSDAKGATAVPSSCIHNAIVGVLKWGRKAVVPQMKSRNQLIGDLRQWIIIFVASCSDFGAIKKSMRVVIDI
jgi:hypothetical protein